MESNAIRLTNRTAIALRRQAKRTRNAYFVMGAVGTLLLLALAVYLGMMWLPAVPLLLALAVATDALLALSAEKSEKQRRRQAVDDLVAMQRDAQRQTEAAHEGDFADALGQTRRMPVVKPAPKPPETGGHRRRRQAGFTVITDDSTKQVQ